MPTRAKTQRPRSGGTTVRESAPAGSVNEVHLVGRLSAPPVVKHLPSGVEVVQLRLVVDRPAGTTRAKSPGNGSRSPTVDTIDIACWTAESRRRALSCTGVEVVDVSGALRRRFWRGPSGLASRYEVEAGKLRVLKRAA
jgi:single-strand DNA-binding protein